MQQERQQKRTKVVPKTSTCILAEGLKDLIEEKRISFRTSAGSAFHAIGNDFFAMRDSQGSALRQEMISMIGEDRPEEDIHEICSKMLGLGFSSSTSSIDDVVKCCFLFKTAADFVSLASDNNNGITKFAIRRAPFYDKCIHPVIERAWDLVLEKHFHQNQPYEGEIGKLVGMRLFQFPEPRLNDHNRNTTMEAKPLVYGSFQEIFKELEGLFHFIEKSCIRTIKYKPSATCLNRYLAEKKAQPFKAPPISTILSLQKINHLRRQYVERKIDAKDYAKKLLGELGGDNIDTEKLLSFKDQPLDFESLLSKLEIESVDTMEEQHTQNLFFNSALSSAFIYVRIIR